jgi:hypothetical protein
MADIPPCGGWAAMETKAFTIGAPAKMMLMITGTYTGTGFGAAPNASRTPNAPTAPTMPATSDHQNPLAGKLQVAPPIFNMASGASTATRK